MFSIGFTDAEARPFECVDDPRETRICVDMTGPRPVVDLQTDSTPRLVPPVSVVRTPSQAADAFRARRARLHTFFVSCYLKPAESAEPLVQ